MVSRILISGIRRGWKEAKIIIDQRRKDSIF